MLKRSQTHVRVTSPTVMKKVCGRPPSCAGVQETVRAFGVRLVTTQASGGSGLLAGTSFVTQGRSCWPRAELAQHRSSPKSTVARGVYLIQDAVPSDRTMDAGTGSTPREDRSAHVKAVGGGNAVTSHVMLTA